MGTHTIVIIISDRMMKKPMLKKLAISLEHLETAYDLYKFRTVGGNRLQEKDNVFLYEKA
jgi:hypothetical protein